MFYATSIHKRIIFIIAILMINSFGNVKYNHFIKSNNQRIPSQKIMNGKNLGLEYKFEAEFENDIKLSLVYQKEDNTKHVEMLDSDITYKDNRLFVEGLEPVGLYDLVTGTACLLIDYRIVDLQKEVIADTYDLGEVPFTLTEEEPFFRVCNSNGGWGIGLPDIQIPKVISEILPEKINGIYAYNQINSYHDGVLLGTIILKQLTPIPYANNQISLNSLALPDKVNKEIIANGIKNSNLEIMANYKFAIPFDLGLVYEGHNTHINNNRINEINDSNITMNKENEGLVNGKSTFFMKVNVIH